MPSAKSYTLNHDIEKKSLAGRCRSIIDFIKILRVEPFLFMLVFQWNLKSLPTSQMLQDKVCRLWYNQTVEYCQGLSKMQGGHGEADDYKSKVLADTAQFSQYQTIISTVPAIFWSLFIG
jgi:hypothetical protein